MSIDHAAPGFTISVSSLSPELRIRARTDPSALRQIIEGQDVTERVIEFTYEDSEKEHDVLRLRVDNEDLVFFDHPMWTKGNVVRFSFGYGGKVLGPLLMVVDNMRGFRTLDITCVENAALANKARPRIFENMTRDQVVQQIVSEGQIPGVYAVDIDTAGFKGESPKDWTWAGETPIEFIKHRLAEKIGYEVYVEEETLFFHERRLADRPVRRFVWHYGAGDLLEFDVTEFRFADRVALTEVRSRDPISRESVSAIGSDDETERDTLGGLGSLAETDGTGEPLAGERIVASPDADLVKEEADTHFKRQEQGEVKATATIIGDPTLRAKSVIEIVGISRTLSGKWYVEKHVHKIGSDGYKGTLTLIKNAVASTGSADPPVLDTTKAKENAASINPDRRNQIVADQNGDLFQRPPGRGGGGGASW